MLLNARELKFRDNFSLLVFGEQSACVDGIELEIKKIEDTRL